MSVTRQRVLAESLGIVLVATIGALWLFSPILSRWTTATAASDLEIVPVNDSFQNVWMLWWTAKAVTSGQSPFQTDMLFYPLNVDLFWQPLQVTNGLLALPITLSFGPIAAYNTIAMLTFISSALAMFWLVRRLGYSSLAAGIAAMMFAFSPFHITKLYDGQLEVMSIQYFPLLTIGLWSIIYGKGLKVFACLLVSCLIVWIVLTSLYYGLFSFMYVGAFFGWSLLINRAPIRQFLRRSVQLVLCFLAPALLLLANLASMPFSEPTVAALRMQGRSAQLIDFILPSPYHPIWGEAVSRLQVSLHPNVGMFNISLGVAIWVLVLIGLLRTDISNKHRLHLALAATFMVLAMGPQFIWNGQPTGIPLPFSLIAEWPGVQAGQRPNHLMILAAVHLCVLAAGGIDALVQRLRSYRFVVTGLLIGCVAFDLFPRPVPGSVMAISPAYQSIPSGTGAILELPFQMEFAGPMIAQIQHQRPILGGYLARIPPYPFANTEGIAPLWLGKDLPTILTKDWRQQLVAVMQAQNIEYVIVHEQLLNAGQRQMTDQLASILDVVYHDGYTSLYRRNEPYQPNVVIALGDGWHKLERDNNGLRWQWTHPQADIHAFNPYSVPQQVLLQMDLLALQSPSTIVIRGGQFELAGIVSTELRVYSVILELAPGHSVLTLEADPVWQLPDEQRTVGIVVRSLRISGCHSNGCEE